MPGNHRIVLEVSTELYGRVEARAAGERYDAQEWVLRTVIVALLPPRPAAERRALDELRAMQIVREIMEGGKSYAANI